MMIRYKLPIDHEMAYSPISYKFLRNEVTSIQAYIPVS